LVFGVDPENGLGAQQLPCAPQATPKVPFIPLGKNVVVAGQYWPLAFVAMSATHAPKEEMRLTNERVDVIVASSLY
jgi:hypothetical protein